MDHLLLAGIVILIFVHFMFILAQIRQDNSVQSFGWPMGFLLIEVVLFTQLSTKTIFQTILLVMVGIWSLRLFIYTLIRNIRRGYEDFRYAELRQNTDKGFLVISYIQFYLVQGIVMYVIALPIIIANEKPISNEISPLSLIGIGIWATGVIIETMSDWQLYKFKQGNPPDAILTTGLWGYSRHINYFGEILVWFGFYIYVLPVEGIWWTIISPLLLSLLLRYVSGVPLIEKRYEDNTAYERYQKEVNLLFPFP